jgi:hypothetical protein
LKGSGTKLRIDKRQPNEAESLVADGFETTFKFLDFYY